MRTQKAIRLEGSDKILQWPNNDVERGVLEELLGDATERKIDRNRLVMVTYHERVRNFNPDNPQYKDVIYRVRLKKLFEMYRDIIGEDYRKPSIEEEEQRWRNEAKRISRGY